MEGELFRSGRLLLPDHPSAAVAPVDGALPFTAELLLILFVFLAILQLNRFLQLLPYLADCVFRARGSADLERSVRVSSDRNLLALTFLIPLVLFMYRYRLYSPSFLQVLDANAQMLAILGVVVVYLLLRQLLYVVLRPRRKKDDYQLAHRSAYTYFILLMLLVLPTVGVSALFGCNDLIVKLLIDVEVLIVYGLYLLRRAQFLAHFCNPFRTFLYLCALEFLPTGLLVLSAILL